MRFRSLAFKQKSTRQLNRVRFLSLAVLIIAGVIPTIHAQTFSVLYNFKGAPDGSMPQGDLLRDGQGNLYGTTSSGGTGNGIVFLLTATGHELLRPFGSQPDGSSPKAGLVVDSTGNAYGTTYGGGSGGDGTVFRINRSGVETVLHSFSGPDGAHPSAGLIRDRSGNLYGTTFYGGTATCSCGTVFKVTSTGTESVLYSFTGAADGKFPQSGLVMDSAGNLYGTASDGGIVNCDNGIHGCGVVFMVDPNGNENVLYSFTGNGDGGQPLAGLVRDSSGTLYGTTFSAGDLSRNCALNHGCGVVFALNTSGQETVLYTFTNGADGANPLADLVRDPSGNLYGTTKLGGQGYGVVFKVDSAGNESVLHTFTGGADGADPLAGVIRDSAGNLYGTASFGGSSEEGVVFKIAP